MQDNTSQGDAEAFDLTTERALALLRDGEMREAHGLLPWSSNYTFLMRIADGTIESLAVYKPRRGERPLWDFPDGTLCQREVAAFLISEALEWHIVPPTILRDGPHGYGSVQVFVRHDPEQNYFNFGSQYTDQLMRVALFDQLINNADRKGGHCLLDSRGHIWAIDHGICFHTQPKLRTVIWDFAGERIPDALMGDVRAFCDRIGEPDFVRAISKMLSRSEIDALQRRAGQIIESGEYLTPGPGRNYPWPPV